MVCAVFDSCLMLSSCIQQRYMRCHCYAPRIAEIFSVNLLQGATDSPPLSGKGTMVSWPSWYKMTLPFLHTSKEEMGWAMSRLCGGESFLGGDRGHSVGALVWCEAERWAGSVCSTAWKGKEMKTEAPRRWMLIFWYSEDIQQCWKCGPNVILA